MALFDVDKNSMDRGRPTPNTHDVLNPGAMMGKSTLSSHYTTDNPTGEGRLQMQNKQIIANNGTDNVALYGYNQALNDWGLFVAQQGVDVTTNTDLSKLVFNSSQDVFKIVLSDTALTTQNNVMNPGAGLFNINTTTTTVPHNLGYAPVILAYLNVVTNYISLPYTVLDATNGTGSATWVAYSATVDETNVYLTVQVLATDTSKVALPALVKYFLLQESVESSP